MNFEELVRQTAQELLDGTAVIFLGAGASMGDDAERAAGKGVPGVGKMTEAIAKQFDVDLKSDADGNLLSTLRGVASVAVQKRDESTVKKFVVDRIRPQCRVPLKAQRALARVAPRIVITTNYDDLYEAAMHEAGKSLEKVVRSEQLARLPQDRLRVLKLHGDLERADEIVLTGQDYQKWQREAKGLKARVVATLQEYLCVFVGYGVSDQNLQDILNIIKENQDASALKHFALVYDVDDELAAELEGTVEFVRGDATKFFERLAAEYEALGPSLFDPALERSNFERHLQSGDLASAGEICKKLANHFWSQGKRAGAGSLWRTFGEAAQEAGKHGAAAAAWRDAGELLLKSGYSLDAEPVLSAALSEAQVAGEPVLEREIQPLLQRARLSVGEYDEVLRDTEQALMAYQNDAAASLIYALRAVRAEAREGTEGTVDGAQEELEAALDELPADAPYYRVRAGVDLARLLSEKFDWDGAHDVLNGIGMEVLNGRDRHDRKELRRCEAILKLARANMHFAVGEDAYASMHYQECAPILEELGETGFAVSALQGVVASAPFLGHVAENDTTARLRDLARASHEQRRCTDLQQQGISYLAEDKLAAARNSFIQSEAAAHALHSPVRARSVRGWLADVLLEAGFAKEALLQYAEVGDRKKVEEVATSLREEMPPQDAGSLPSIEWLLELATNGPLHSRGAALTALGRLWDVLPEGMLPELADHLESLSEMPNLVWADRSVLTDAADLARVLTPRFTEEQAERVGAAVVSTIEKDDVFWTARKSACLALANLARSHPPIVEKLSMPTDRLAVLVGTDLFNDTVSALMALANLGLSGHVESKEKVLELLSGADPYTRASWRQIFGEATDDELVSATQLLLPRSVSRVEKNDGYSTLSMGAVTPMFLRDWYLPESVRSDVARTLFEAVVDPAVALTHRQAAALILGLKAEQFDEGDREKCIDALKNVLTRPFEADPMNVSITNPLSMLRTNIGESEDVISAAAEALIAFSPWIDDEDERRWLRRQMERLRASQVEGLGVGVADGLQRFAPKGVEEERWLHARLLLLLNSQYARVRQGAARSLAALVERKAVTFNAELLDTILHLSAVGHVGDRVVGALALSTMSKDPGWNQVQVTEALEDLRKDTNYLVRRHVEGSSAQ